MMKKYFDPNETQFQTLKGMSGDGTKKAIEAFAPVYDSAQHDNAIQMELNYLSSKCMLGPNYYSFKDGAVGYQNELGLALSNSALRRSRNMNLNRLKKVMIASMKSILFLEKEKGTYTGSLELTYDVLFDDDIFTDDKSKLDQMRLDAQDGFIPEYIYVMAAYKLSKPEAIAMLEEADGFEEVVIEPVVNPDEVEDAEE